MCWYASLPEAKPQFLPLEYELYLVTFFLTSKIEWTWCEYDLKLIKGTTDSSLLSYGSVALGKGLAAMLGGQSGSVWRGLCGEEPSISFLQPARTEASWCSLTAMWVSHPGAYDSAQSGLQRPSLGEMLGCNPTRFPEPGHRAKMLPDSDPQKPCEILNICSLNC